MKKKVLFELKSIYRDSMRINGFLFGSGEKSACIVGGMRGNEMQQVYCCSQLVKALKAAEADGRIRDGKSILVIPAVNPYSLNIGKRFWPTDNTDINRMFPGYDLGETTQRIAAGIWKAVEGYEYGVHFASNYMPGKFIPNVRMMHTGYEDVEAAKQFGLPYVVLRNPRPYDTTVLNFNWQLWNTKAFSLFTSETNDIDKHSAQTVVVSVLNFLNNMGIIEYHNHKGYISTVVEEEKMVSVKSDCAGFFEEAADIDDVVTKGQLLARILDPCEGTVKSELVSPANGKVFFVQTAPMPYEGALLFKILQ